MNVRKFMPVGSAVRELQDYLDNKGIEDAVIAQNGIVDEFYHADGVHRKKRYSLEDR